MAAAVLQTLAAADALQDAAGSSAHGAGLTFNRTRAATCVTWAFPDARCIRRPFVAGIFRFVGLLHEQVLHEARRHAPRCFTAQQQPDRRHCAPTASAKPIVPPLFIGPPSLMPAIARLTKLLFIDMRTLHANEWQFILLRGLDIGRNDSPIKSLPPKPNRFRREKPVPYCEVRRRVLVLLQQRILA